MRRLVAIALAALLTSSGCSFLLVDPVSRPSPEQSHAGCDLADSRWSRLDLSLFAVASTVSWFGSLLLMLRDDRSARRAQVLGGIALGGGVFGTSGIYGDRQVQRCRTIHDLDRFDERLREPGKK